MTTRKYFEFTCLGCQGVFKRRSDKASQSHYCRPCRGKKTATTHGFSRSRLYRIWQGFNQRCQNPNGTGYVSYGGSGIEVCEEWQTFEPFKNWAFANGYAENLTIDRIDNSLGYNPDNCKWSTMLEQSQNRTNGLNWLAVKEIRTAYKTRTYADIAKQYGVHRHTIFLVCNNRIWHDPNFVPTRHHRWNKNPFPIPRQSDASSPVLI